MAVIVVAPASSDPFLDNFDGTGALSGWTRFNAGNQAASRVSGKCHHPVDIGDNASNSTAWFDDGTLYVGQLYYRTITRPGSGTDYYYFVGFGIGPQSNPDNDLTVVSHNYAFMAAVCANTLATDDTVEWEHVSPGIRFDGTARATIERKTKLNGGNSSQNDIGSTAPNTKFNIRLGVPNTGSLTWAYQAEGQDPAVDAWTDISAGMPGTRMTPASTLYVGFTAYSFDGTIVSGEEFTGVIDRTYSVTA